MQVTTPVFDIDHLVECAGNYGERSDDDHTYADGDRCGVLPDVHDYACADGKTEDPYNQKESTSDRHNGHAAEFLLVHQTSHEPSWADRFPKRKDPRLQPGVFVYSCRQENSSRSKFSISLRDVEAVVTSSSGASGAVSRTAPGGP